MLAVLMRLRQFFSGKGGVSPFAKVSGQAAAKWTDCEAHYLTDAVTPLPDIQRSVVIHRKAATIDLQTTRALLEAPSVLDEHGLHKWHEQGVCGVRFPIGGHGKTDFESILRYAEGIARLDWHVEFDILPSERPVLAGSEWTLMRFPVAICFNRFGGFDPGRGLKHPDIEALLSLLGTGRTWLKLSDAPSISSQPAPWTDLSPLVHAALAIRKDRVVWGSGVGRSAKPVHIADALNALKCWIPDAEQRNRVLSTNPARLYGFDTTR